MGPNCRRIKKRTRRYRSRTWTLVEYVFLEASDSRWSRHHGHHQACQFVESKKIGIDNICSSTRKWYFHATTGFQLAVAKKVKEERTFSKPSERKTRTLTITCLERDAASGDRKRDVERVRRDLSRVCVDKHHDARNFITALLRCALAHILVSSPQHYLKFRCKLSDFWQESDRTQLFDRAIGKPVVRFPHGASHRHLAHLSFPQKGHYTLHIGWTQSFTTPLCNKKRIMLSVKIHLRQCIIRT